ncbi:MAG: serine/threonine protein kinase [Myxococcales bacterium]|nr:serine/threonine protein kinase [Myxococcales bacterium]
MQSDPLIGTVIEGRYRVLECLGEGAMGAVYVAEQLALNKSVALKIIRRELAGIEGAAERFAREAMVTSRFHHPNVIAALDYGRLPDGGAFLAMELVHGRSLRALLNAERSLPWVRACMVGAQIADALSAAERHGIVHRDIKPENILIELRDGGLETVKVLDFGIARFDQESSVPTGKGSGAQLTRQGTVVGTPGYMAPEQAVGDRTDHRSDLYALGAVLWECLVGRRLWQEENFVALVKTQLRTEPPSARESSGDLTIPLELDRLISSLLAVDPNARPSSGGEVRDILRLIGDAGRGSGAFVLPMAPLVERLAGATGPSANAMGPAKSITDSWPPANAASPSSAPPSPLSSPPSVAPSQPPPRRSYLSLLLFSLVAAGAGALVYTGQLDIAINPGSDLDQIANKVAGEIDLHAPRGQTSATGGPGASVKVTPQAAEATGLSPALATRLSQLVNGETRAERVDGAEALLAHVPMDEVPSYARLLAHFQLANTCDRKKPHLLKLTELGDRRALPALVMASQRAKEGCGKANRDCLACMRGPLDALIAKLEAVQLEADGR